ncbi:MAG: PEP-utilizing enzyme [Desulfobacteraceae bacterium]|nr:PEP-utilizing enzyme [Desulfobacteraceae bacterium]
MAGRPQHSGPAPACHPVRLVLERFRRVLAHNNHALELIADMGEKLGGDFLFDQRYILDSLARLTAAVRTSIEALNELDDQRHQELFPVCDRLTAQLRAVAAGREEREGPLLLPLAAIRPRHWGLVGGKFAHLAEICRDELVRVPEGFVVTTRAYHDLVEANGLREAIDRFEGLLSRADAEAAEVEELRGRLETALRQASPPPGLLAALAEQLAAMPAAGQGPFALAVRSSAEGEDLELSFAGLYRSLLNVPAETESLFQAYREVVASLFSPPPVQYRRRLLPGEGPFAMAVGCQRLIEAAASGVAYSADPLAPGGSALIVSGSWGLGEAVVAGGPADSFRLEKTPPFRLLASQTGDKRAGRYPAPAGGLEERPIPPADRNRPCLTPDQLAAIAARVVRLENLARRPVDVEWAIDTRGGISILQARPLLVREPEADARALPAALDAYEQLSSGQGKVVQQGIGAGPVFLVSSQGDLQHFPDGAVLVSRRDSPSFARVMHRAAAIVTEIGTPVSHMATLCREARVPCLVDVPSILDKVRPGMEITVDAEDRRIYRGRVAELATYRAASLNLEASREFRLLRRVVKTVSRLHLLDPLLRELTLEDCQSYHDLLRYIHEMAVSKLVEVGRDERCLLRDHLVRRLDLPIPAGILVIDIDGGLAPEAPPDQVPFAAVTSVPFRAILQGMLFPGAWHRETMPVGFMDLVSSMVNMPPNGLVGQYTGHNIAVISRDYVNLCFRFGYHFNIIDAHCHEVARDNHIYFRFLGGATDLTKKSRRAKLIALILEALDFKVRVKGDLVIGRAGNMVRSEMERTLDLLGRLVGFTRQLDVRLESDASIDHYARAFLLGNYDVVSKP